MRTLWKQDASLHPTFAKLNRSLEDDWFLLPYELDLQAAHAQTLQAAGILTESECADIRAALDRIGGAWSGKPCPDSTAEDIHTWIEQALTEAVGDAGRKIHTARSRNDQVATLLKMYVIEAAGQLADSFRLLASVFCTRAKDWADAIFPLQTHAQFAAPGSAGFWSLRYAAAFDRMRQRCVACVEQWQKTCPLGAGAVAGSSIPIDRNVQADMLGFAAPAVNALDATTTRDECLELLALIAQAGLHLQSFAADVIGFSQTPFAWTVYPKAFGTGSSMMPNKTNPDAMELLRGECAALQAAHGQALILLKGLPSGYNRDLQCIKPLVKNAVEKLGELCAMTHAFVEQLDFDRKKLEAALTSGHIDATLRMEQMVLDGTPLRDAHHAVAASLESGGSAYSADSYRTIGSASPSETRRIADSLLADLEA